MRDAVDCAEAPLDMMDIGSDKLVAGGTLVLFWGVFDFVYATLNTYVMDLGFLSRLLGRFRADIFLREMAGIELEDIRALAHFAVVAMAWELCAMFILAHAWPATWRWWSSFCCRCIHSYVAWLFAVWLVGMHVTGASLNHEKLCLPDPTGKSTVLSGMLFEEASQVFCHPWALSVFGSASAWGTSAYAMVRSRFQPWVLLCACAIAPTPPRMMLRMKGEWTGGVGWTLGALGRMLVLIMLLIHWGFTTRLRWCFDQDAEMMAFAKEIDLVGQAGASYTEDTVPGCRGESAASHCGLGLLDKIDRICCMTCNGAYSGSMQNFLAYSQRHWLVTLSFLCAIIVVSLHRCMRRLDTTIVEWIDVAQNGGTDTWKDMAAAALRHITENGLKNCAQQRSSPLKSRIALAKAGGIQALLSLAKEGATEIQRSNAAAALDQLSFGIGNVRWFAAAEKIGGPPRPNFKLSDGTMTDAIPLLVHIVKQDWPGPEGFEGRARDSLKYLANLAEVGLLDASMVTEAGGIPALVANSTCMTEHRKEKEALNEVREDAALVLGELAYIDSECQAAIRVAGGIRPLVVLLVKRGTERRKEIAMAALQKLAHGSPENQAAIADVGGIPHLIKLAASGTEQQKQDAGGLLRVLATNADLASQIKNVRGPPEFEQA